MNVNIVHLGGRLTKDVKLSYTSNQTAVAEFGMAVNKKWKDKETVLFIDLVAFGDRANTLNKYVGKGDELFVSGELQLDSWETKEGGKRSKHKVLVNSFQFIGGKKETTPENRQVPDDKPDDDKPW